MKRFVSQIFVMVFIFYFAGNSASAAGMKNEPKDFREIAWKTNINGLNGFKLSSSASDPNLKLKNFYKKDNDRLIIGGAKLQSILYMFYGKKFCGVQIEFNLINSANKLMELYVNLYGNPNNEATDNFMVRRYVWKGKEVKVEFIWNKPLKKGVVYYYYMPIIDKQEKERANYEKMIDKRDYDAKEKKAKGIAADDL